MADQPRSRFVHVPGHLKCDCQILLGISQARTVTIDETREVHDLSTDWQSFFCPLEEQQHGGIVSKGDHEGQSIDRSLMLEDVDGFAFDIHFVAELAALRIDEAKIDQRRCRVTVARSQHPPSDSYGQDQRVPGRQVIAFVSEDVP